MKSKSPEIELIIQGDETMKKIWEGFPKASRLALLRDWDSPDKKASQAYKSLREYVESNINELKCKSIIQVAIAYASQARVDISPANQQLLIKTLLPKLQGIPTSDLVVNSDAITKQLSDSIYANSKLTAMALFGSAKYPLDLQKIGNIGSTIANSLQKKWAASDRQESMSSISNYLEAAIVNTIELRDFARSGCRGLVDRIRSSGDRDRVAIQAEIELLSRLTRQANLLIATASDKLQQEINKPIWAKSDEAQAAVARSAAGESKEQELEAFLRSAKIASSLPFKANAEEAWQLISCTLAQAQFLLDQLEKEQSTAKVMEGSVAAASPSALTSFNSLHDSVIDTALSSFRPLLLRPQFASASHEASASSPAHPMGFITKGLQTLQIQPSKSITIDFSKIQSAFDRDGARALVGLALINGNVSIPSLQTLKADLEDPSFDQIKHISALFDTLEELASRYAPPKNDSFGIYSSYQAALKDGVNSLVKSDPGLQHNFLEACKKASAINCAESIAAEALTAILDNKSQQEIKSVLTAASAAFNSSSAALGAKDLGRAGYIYIVNEAGVSTRIPYQDLSKRDSKEHASFPQLTGEQIGFINQMWHQDCLHGGWAKHFDNEGGSLTNKAQDLEGVTSRHPCIKFSGGRVYVMEYSLFEALSADTERSEKCNSLVSADITDLKGESFSNGFASHDVPIKLVMTEIEPGAIKAMNIPDSIRSESAPELCIFHETHSAIGQKALQDQLKAPSLSLPDFESSKTSTKNLERQVQELQQRLKEELKIPEVRQDRQRSHSIPDLHSKSKPQARRGSDSTYNR